MSELEFRDLQPYDGELTAEDELWLERVRTEVNPADLIVSLAEEGTAEPDLLVSRAGDGTWVAGRYVGAMTFQGRRLVVKPRLGIRVIEAWLDQALGVLLPPTSSTPGESEAFIVQLLARVWCRALGGALRHGPPFLRIPDAHEGLYVRGRLDLRRTLELRRRGREAVASTSSLRSLNHAMTRVIVCADRVLDGRLPAKGQWRTERVRETMPHMRAAVGNRPNLPSSHELERIRYTPITLPFKNAVRLSHRIARQMGYTASHEPGAAEGLLLDVAELWELFVLNCARIALRGEANVSHGTTADRRDYLLLSKSAGRGLGCLKPDVLVERPGETLAVIDAKYKRLAPSIERRDGVDRADLYQLISYLARYATGPQTLGALAYPDFGPLDPSEMSRAEAGRPWHTEAGTRVEFIRLPTGIEECVRVLHGLVQAPDIGSGLAA